MASSSRITIHPGALERVLRSPKSLAYQRKQGRRIADAWRANIHRITGATERSIDVEEEAGHVIVTADTARDRESAWVFLEYGTSSMRAQAPGRRAIGRARG